MASQKLIQFILNSGIDKNVAIFYIKGDCSDKTIYPVKRNVLRFSWSVFTSLGVSLLAGYKRIIFCSCRRPTVVDSVGWTNTVGYWSKLNSSASSRILLHLPMGNGYGAFFYSSTLKSENCWRIAGVQSSEPFWRYASEGLACLYARKGVNRVCLS